MPDYQATRVQGETLSLSTTLASLGVLPNYEQFILYAPSSDFRLHLNPALVDAVFFDESASSGSEYNQDGGDLVRNLADRNTSNGTGTLLDSSTTSDFLYLCFSDPIGGIRVVIGSANSTASTTLVGHYRQNDDSWQAFSSLSDGTDSGGVALAQTGSVTWTAPTDWKSSVLVGPSDSIVDNATTGEAGTRRGFWMRLSWDEALDSDTEIDEIWALNRDANRGYFRSGTEYVFTRDTHIGAIESLLASGTDTLQVTWIKSVH